MSSQELMRELTVCWVKAQPIVAAFVRSMVPDFHESEDLVQEVAEGVAANFNQYDRSRPFVAWAIGIARHKITDYRRRRSRDRHVFESDAMARIADAYASGQDELEPMKEALEQCLEQTRGRARKLLEMRYTREMPLASIADKLGISRNLAAVSLFRTRQALGRCIENRIASGSGVVR